MKKIFLPFCGTVSIQCFKNKLLGMRYLIICLLVIISLSACNNREDYFGQVVTLSLKKTGTTELATYLKDSVKVPNSYVCSYVISSGEAIIPQGHFKAGSGTITPSSNGTFVIAPAPGENIIEFTIKDKTGHTSTAELALTAFDNLPPVAVLQLVPYASGVYKFSGKQSYDKDAKYGGKIVYYKFSLVESTSGGINNQYDSTQTDTMRYTFSSDKKTYTISLKVKDNSNKWSDLTTKTLITGN
jgi:hypothetical protein